MSEWQHAQARPERYGPPPHLPVVDLNRRQGECEHQAEICLEESNSALDPDDRLVWRRLARALRSSRSPDCNRCCKP